MMPAMRFLHNRSLYKEVNIMRLRTKLCSITAFAAVAAAIVMPIPSPAQSALTPLAIGAIPTDAGSVVYYAQDMNFFEKNGIDAKITNMPNGASLAAAVVGGSLDIGLTNAGTLAQAREKGVAIKFVAPSSLAIAPSAGTDLIMVASKSTIRTGADLNGKTIAVTALKNLTQISVQAWVDAHGGDAKTLHFVEIPPSQTVAAIESGRVDAGSVTEPYISAAKKAGQGRSIGDAFESMAPRLMITGWFATDAWLAAHPELATRFQTAVRQAAEWANDHPHESAIILAKRTGLPPDVAETMKRARFGLTLDPALIKPVIDLAVKYGALDAPIDVAQLVWLAPAK
jgi:NitT/TauT family transport system substrate-binding protein